MSDKGSVAVVTGNGSGGFEQEGGEEWETDGRWIANDLGGHSTSSDLVPGEDISALNALNGLSHPCAGAFLTAYREVGTIRAAAEIVGVSRKAHYHWLGRSGSKALEGYEEAFEAVKEDVRDRAIELLRERVENGFREERRDSGDNLLFYRIRHDASLLKMYLQKLFPEVYGSEKSQDQKITVIFEMVDVKAARTAPMEADYEVLPKEEPDR